MIGKIVKAYTPFYDTAARKTQFKTRPALIIAKADNYDFVALPVSKISLSKNISPIYDIKIDPNLYPLTNLITISCVRTHKQCIIHQNNLGDTICNLKLQYNDLYVRILEKREKFNKEITKQALGAGLITIT